MDSLGLVSYEEWSKQNFNLYIQMYNSVIQLLDFQLEVVYPVEYIAAAFPLYHPEREYILALSRQILAGEFWFNFVKHSLCFHPRRIACNLFDEAVLL